MVSSDERERRALKELKAIVQEAISSNRLMDDVVVNEEAKTPLLAGHHHGGTISIFGLPLLLEEDDDDHHDRTDVIIYKFLQDKNFRVRDSFEAIKNTLRWRREFGVDDHDYSSESEPNNNLFVVSGKDRQGRPVCYNALHGNLPDWVTFNSSRERFIRSWILSVERSIREHVDFRPGRVNAILQVHDLDKCSRSWLQELNDHLIPLLEEFYPQSIAKQVFINTPWIHRVYTMRSKFQFVGPSKTAHTLSKYISPEQLPIPYARDEPKIDESTDQESIQQLAVLFSYLSKSKRRALLELTKLVAGEIRGPSLVSIWGVPLLQDWRTYVVLLKFLEANKFGVKASFSRIKKTIHWRKDFEIDRMVEEEEGDNSSTVWDKLVHISGKDRENHPVWYTMYGEFQDNEVYAATFSDLKSKDKFMEWKLVVLEKNIRKHIEFVPGGVSSFMQVADLRRCPRNGVMLGAIRNPLGDFKDYYPGFFARQVFIDAPKCWSIMPHDTSIKFVPDEGFLFRYITPDEVPIPMGGLWIESCESSPSWPAAAACEIDIRGGQRAKLTYRLDEDYYIMIWEVRVAGWEVMYSVEFVPDGVAVATRRERKISMSSMMDNRVIYDSIGSSGPGTLVVKIHNLTCSRKKLVYRFVREKGLGYVPGPNNTKTRTSRSRSLATTSSSTGPQLHLLSTRLCCEHGAAFSLLTGARLIEPSASASVTPKGGTLCEIKVMPSDMVAVVIKMSENTALDWHIRAEAGWAVTYSVDFKPDSEDGLATRLKHWQTTMSSPLICHAFTTTESGFLLIELHNFTSNPKKLLWKHSRTCDPGLRL